MILPVHPEKAAFFERISHKNTGAAPRFNGGIFAPVLFSDRRTLGVPPDLAYFRELWYNRPGREGSGRKEPREQRKEDPFSEFFSADCLTTPAVSCIIISRSLGELNINRIFPEFRVKNREFALLSAASRAKRRSHRPAGKPSRPMRKERHS
jgi:hypothetical protein